MKNKNGLQRSPFLYCNAYSQLGSFRHHRDGDIRHHVHKQRDIQLVIANLLKVTLRHAHLRFFDREAVLGKRRNDVGIGD